MGGMGESGVIPTIHSSCVIFLPNVEVFQLGSAITVTSETNPQPASFSWGYQAPAFDAYHNPSFSEKIFKKRRPPDIVLFFAIITGEGGILGPILANNAWEMIIIQSFIKKTLLIYLITKLKKYFSWI